MLQDGADYFRDEFASEMAASGSTVTLNWVDYSDGAAFDPVTEAMTSGVATPMTKDVPAFLHFIQPSQMTLDHFAELEVGDCIVDFAPDVPLDGKRELSFTIAGERWEQKKVSQRVLQHFDAIVGDRKLVRTLVLKKAT